LETVHRSVERLRLAVGRTPGDRFIADFETALGEIGANVLTHGSPPGSPSPVDYSLSWDGAVAVATFTDPGPAVHSLQARAMPAHSSEDGRGLVMARMLLDELGYERAGRVNRWRLVKRL